MTYKLLTAVATIILQHVERNNIMPAEQCALAHRRRGCLDALLVNSMVSREAVKSKRNHSVAWIDYSKAFDRVPHKWLIKMLKYIRAPKPLRRTLASLIPLWKSKFCLGRGRTAVKVDIQYRHGLFQGTLYHHYSSALVSLPCLAQ